MERWSTRPKEDPERSAVVDFAGSLDRAALDPLAGCRLERFHLAALAWTDAVRARAEASAKANLAGDAARDADAAFRLAFDRWAASIDAENRRGYAAKELRPSLGDRPVSVFLRAARPEKLARMGPLFARVERTPALVGDPARLQALRDATAALAELHRLSGRALGSRAIAVRAVAAASAAFDKAWGKLARELADSLPAEPLPRFRRSSRSSPPQRSIPASGGGARDRADGEAAADGGRGERSDAPPR